MRHATWEDAVAAALRADIELRPYLCDRCRRYHLTSRTKGKRALRDTALAMPPPPR